MVLPVGQKFFSIRELKEMGLSLYKINKLVNLGELVKLNKSCYENTKYIGDESDYYYVTAYVPKGVICLLSAAAYYNLTTYIPDVVDVAIPRKSRVSTLPDWPQLQIHYYTDSRYELGIETVKEGHNSFQIYDIEKALAFTGRGRLLSVSDCFPDQCDDQFFFFITAHFRITFGMNGC